MRIGVDIDGVLNDYAEWRSSCAFKFCCENNIDRGFNPYTYMLEDQFNLTDEENYKFWKEINCVIFSFIDCSINEFSNKKK
jgi:uncharacterized HAD superfamily protein